MVTDQENDIYTKEYMEELRKNVTRRREELFRKHWKNRRPALPLRSLQQEKSFQFVVEWYEEFDEVIGRERERTRLDRLIAQGEDVNAPHNKK